MAGSYIIPVTDIVFMLFVFYKTKMGLSLHKYVSEMYVPEVWPT